MVIHHYFNGEILLFNACGSKNENLVKYLIELGIDINKENDKGETSIIYCI